MICSYTCETESERSKNNVSRMALERDLQCVQKYIQQHLTVLVVFYQTHVKNKTLKSN
jgi:hypothetical protein